MGERQKTLKMLAGKCGEGWYNVGGGGIMILKNSFVCRQDIVLQCDTATVRKPFNWLDSPRGCAVVRKKTLLEELRCESFTSINTLITN